MPEYGPHFFPICVLDVVPLFHSLWLYTHTLPLSLSRSRSFCLFHSNSILLCACFLLCAAHNEKSFVFTHCFLLCQIYCMYRLKFIHINHIINTHLQCTKNFMQYLRSARVIFVSVSEWETERTRSKRTRLPWCWRQHRIMVAHHAYTATVHHTQNMTKAMHAILNYSVRLP